MDIQEKWIQLCRGLGSAISTVNRSLADAQDTTSWETQDFFSSYETSYSMTLAYPEDLLIESAKAVGIPVEGRDKLDIVRDMVILQRQRDQEQHHEPS